MNLCYLVEFCFICFIFLEKLICYKILDIVLKDARNFLHVDVNLCVHFSYENLYVYLYMYVNLNVNLSYVNL